MAGHNKWSKIKRKKGVADAKRSKIFSKIINEISVAVKEGSSGDPDFNPRLRVAIANAKGANMPKDNVDRAIKKALDSDSGSMNKPTYEGYAPGGIALFIECTTDNLKRTIANIRSYLNKHNGSLGTNGSVDFMFERKGVFIIPKGEWDEEELTLELIDSGLEEIEDDGDEFSLTVSYEDFGNMLKKLEDLSIEMKSAKLERFPLTTKTVDLDVAKRALKLIDIIEDDDDVQAVFHNMEMTDELMNALNE